MIKYMEEGKSHGHLKNNNFSNKEISTKVTMNYFLPLSHHRRSLKPREKSENTYDYKLKL